MAVDRALEGALRARVDGKAKPPGSLGRIEDLAVQLGLICGSLITDAGQRGAVGVRRRPWADRRRRVALSDKRDRRHGPRVPAGRASINAFAAARNVEIRVVDAGVAADLPAHPDLIAAKIRPGTRNAAREPALTAE